MEEEDPKKPQKVPHGGCGSHQPDTIRKEGLKLTATYKNKKKDDDDGQGDRKEPITPLMAQQILRPATAKTKSWLLARGSSGVVVPAQAKNG